MNRLALEWWVHDNRRLTMAALIVCAAVVSVATRPGLKAETLGEEAVDALAWVIVGAGLVLRLWATTFIGGRKNRQLVTTGPYRIVRHPLYLGSALALVGVLLIAQRLLGACARCRGVRGVWVGCGHGGSPAEQAVPQAERGVSAADASGVAPTGPARSGAA